MQGLPVGGGTLLLHFKFDSRFVHESADMLGMADTMLELKCACCGEDFERRAAEVKRQRSKGRNTFYCSSVCTKEAKATEPKNCGNCGKFFFPKEKSAKYCNRSCAASVNNSLFPKREPVAPIYGSCLHCGASFVGRGHWKYLKYCDNTCAAAYRLEPLLESWLKDEVDGSGKAGGLRAVFRRYLLTEADYKCTECEWGKPNPVTGKPILSIDHIDGNWQNNKRSNLKVLCYNCHTLTPTFGSLNKTVDGTRPRGVRAYPSQNGALKVVDRETQAKVN